MVRTSAPTSTATRKSPDQGIGALGQVDIELLAQPN
jgi:hypothetical protein